MIARAVLGPLALAALIGACARPSTQRSAVGIGCDSSAVSTLRLEGARVTSATRVAAGALALPGIQAAAQRIPAFCRVRGEATSAPGSRINFELWLPEGTAWNGKLVATGNGGYSSALAYGDMTMVLRRGYAALGGDTGHQTDDPNDLRFVVGHRERLEDWGTRSIHAIVGPAKAIAAALGGRLVRRAYFYGCSTGGQQGFAELQRYPEDFDGVIAGAPGHSRVRLNAGFLWQYRANHAPNDDTTPILTPAKLALITRTVVAACDAIDGVRDGVLDDPRECPWKPESLRCAATETRECLTAAQVAALEKMYAGARNPRTGEQVYPGWPKGSEAPVVADDGTVTGGWHLYWGTTQPTRADFWRYWVFGDPQWSWWRFDFDRDLATADEKVGRAVDHTNVDLTAFKRRGGKAIVYHGWADPVASAFDVISYYDRLRAREGSQGATDEYFRLFMVPGMAHCARGPGATIFGNPGAESPLCDAQHDLLEALDRWVEQGVAPERIVASRLDGRRVTRTRPLCPYPRRAVYVGTGSTDDASSFTCR
ncbi:MAG TPA: tannase/feruloyl esterase family alpha/beta hydrolase [Gemmatimonadaceae bacterium]|nr:tannase/feruloyl esterase family alpha/beta hydrolase [Gemmatimonadaceae bacterium]